MDLYSIGFRICGSGFREHRMGPYSIRFGALR